MMADGASDDVSLERLPMIPVPIKAGSSIDFASPIKRYIDKVYQQPGDHYAHEVTTISNLRAQCLRVLPSEASSLNLRKYFAQLTFMEPRFGPGTSGRLGASFQWTDTFSGLTVTVPNLPFEKASILYNIGATEAELGRKAWASQFLSDEMLKTACNHFQTAAGAFLALSEVSQESARDLSPRALSVLKPLMMGQAQECYLIKALEGAKKRSLIARMCTQVAEYYDDTHTGLLLLSPADSHPWHRWPTVVRVKAMYYRSLAHFFKSMEAHQDDAYGIEVSRLRAAASLLADVKDAMKEDTGLYEFESAIELQSSIVETKLAGAEKDNDSIYHERVPPETSLDEIKPASVLHAAAYTREEGFPDIFKRLVPMKIHMASSEYSEKNAQLFRKVCAEVDDKNVELQRSLSSMGLLHGFVTETQVELPTDVFKSAALLRDTRPHGEGIPAVKALLEEVTAARTAAREALEACHAEVDQVAEVVPRLVEEFAGREASLAQAEALDTDVRDSFEAVLPSLDLLAGPHEKLRKQLPTKSILEGPPPDAEAEERLRTLVSKATLMTSLRSKLIAELRKQLNDDDITQRLITSKDGEALMEKGYALHAAKAEEIRANLASQAKLLPAIIEANAKFTPSRVAAEQLEGQQKKYIDGLLSSCETFGVIKEKLRESLAFYSSLRDSTTQLEARAKAKAASVEASPATTPLDVANNPFFGSAPAAPTPATAPAPAAATAPPSALPLRLGRSVQRPARPMSWAAPAATGARPLSATPVNSVLTEADESPQPASPTAGGVPAAAPIADDTALVDNATSARGGRASLTRRHSLNPFDIDAQHLDELASITPPASGGTLRARLSSLEESTSTDEQAPAVQPPQQPSVVEAFVNSFAAHIQRLKARNHRAQTGFEQEFNLLKLTDLQTFKSEMVSIAQQNRSKNRYKDILPLNRARVKLQVATSARQPGDDYINASFLKEVLPGCSDFIAAQGPTPATNGDFWKMIKQQRCRGVVMVTNLVEKGRVKCDQYWPDAIGQESFFPETPGGLAVKVTKTAERDPGQGWIERDFTIVDANGSHSVVQFHFVSWPDRGVPAQAHQFVSFMDSITAFQHKAEKEAAASGNRHCPLLVHCSAGIGRTGTFIGVYAAKSALPLLQSGTPIDIDMIKLVNRMREFRRHMVQTPEQYEFCYFTILHISRQYLTAYKERAAAMQQSMRKVRPTAPLSAVAPSALPISTHRPGEEPAQQNVLMRRQASLKRLSGAAASAVRRASADISQKVAVGAASLGTKIGEASKQVAKSWTTPPALCCSGHAGTASFINGVYVREPAASNDGKPVFKHTSGVPMNFDHWSGKPLFLYYHGTNAAWVIAMAIGSLDVIAYASGSTASPDLLTVPWMVTSTGGQYQPDPKFNVSREFPAHLAPARPLEPVAAAPRAAAASPIRPTSAVVASAPPAAAPAAAPIVAPVAVPAGVAAALSSPPMSPTSPVAAQGSLLPVSTPPISPISPAFSKPLDGSLMVSSLPVALAPAQPPAPDANPFSSNPFAAPAGTAPAPAPVPAAPAPTVHPMPSWPAPMPQPPAQTVAAPVSPAGYLPAAGSAPGLPQPQTLPAMAAPAHPAAGPAQRPPFQQGVPPAATSSWQPPPQQPQQPLYHPPVPAPVALPPQPVHTAAPLPVNTPFSLIPGPGAAGQAPMPIPPPRQPAMPTHSAAVPPNPLMGHAPAPQASMPTSLPMTRRPHQQQQQPLQPPHLAGYAASPALVSSSNDNSGVLTAAVAAIPNPFAAAPSIARPALGPAPGIHRPPPASSTGPGPAGYAVGPAGRSNGVPPPSTYAAAQSAGVPPVSAYGPPHGGYAPPASTYAAVGPAGFPQAGAAAPGYAQPPMPGSSGYGAAPGGGQYAPPSPGHYAPPHQPQHHAQHPYPTQQPQQPQHPQGDVLSLFQDDQGSALAPPGLKPEKPFRQPSLLD